MIFSGFKKKAKRNSLKKPYSKESSDIPSKSQAYASCSELPLWNFIQILTTGELSYLGNGTPSELQEAWQNIYYEYFDAMPSKKSIYTIQLDAEIKYLESKIDIIQTIFDAFKQMYIPDLIPILNEYGFYYEFTPETMFDDLKKVEAECKSFVVQKEVKKAEYKRFIDEESKKPQSKTNWDDIITELSQFQGYELNEKVLTVSKFVAIFNRYNNANNNGKQPKD